MKLKAELIYDHTPPTGDFLNEGIYKKEVQKGLRYIKEGGELYAPRKTSLESILTAYFAGNEVFDGEGGVFMRSSKIYDIVKNHINKEDFLEWQITSYGETSLSKEELLTMDVAHKKTFERFLVESGVSEAFTDEYGVREVRASQGECNLMVSKGKDNKLVFNPLRLSQVKIPKGTLKWRTLRKLVITFDSVDYDDFISTFPDNEKAKKIQWGNLPSLEDKDNINYNETQNGQTAKREGQYAIFIDLDNKKATYFGGTGASVFQELKDDSFPWLDKKGEPTFPIFRFVYDYPQEGYYCLGLGDLFYQVNALDEYTKNKKVKAIDQATKQYLIHNVDAEGSEDFENSLYDADIADQEGRTAHIINKVSQDQKGHMGSSIIGGNASGLNELTFADAIIDKALIDRGTTLQEVGAEKGKPLGTFQIEVEKAQGKIKEVAVRNSREWVRFLEFCHTLWLQHASTTDNEAVPMSDEAIIASGEGKDIELTVGDVVAYAKSRKFFIETDETTGVIPNETLESQKGQFLLEQAQGTPAYAQILSKLAKRMGYSLSEESLALPQEQPQGQIQLPQQNGTV